MTGPSRPAKRSRSTYERALDMLEARARGSTELRRKLLAKGEPVADVDAALERLQRAGLIDDAVYARQFARSKALGAGHSRRRLKQELTERGVARDVTDAAIEDVFSGEDVDEGAAIERIARKKLRMLTRADESTRRRRLYAFLARRGYESEDIRGVLRLLLDAEPE